MCPAPTTMTDSIIATQRTRDRTFFCGQGLGRGRTVRPFPRFSHGLPTKKWKNLVDFWTEKTPANADEFSKFWIFSMGMLDVFG